MLSREEILGGALLRRETASIDGLGEIVVVELGAHELVEVTGQIQASEPGTLSVARLAVRQVYRDGELLFRPDDVAAVAQLPAGVLGKLEKICARVNGRASDDSGG